MISALKTIPLPLNLQLEIYSFIEPRYKLRDWVYENRKKLDVKALCGIPEAMDYISDLFETTPIPWNFWSAIFRNRSVKAENLMKKYNKDGFFDITQLYEMYENPYYIDIIEEKLKNESDEVIWIGLAKNPHQKAIDIIKKDIEAGRDFKNLSLSQLRWNCDCEDADDYIGCICDEYKCWGGLCQNKNPEAISLIEKNIDRLKENCWEMLCSNTSAISIVEKNLDLLDDVCWKELSYNTAAISILEKNLDKVDWTALSTNTSAINILQENLDKVNWSALSTNSAAISILEKNKDNIDWFAICENKNALSLIEERLEIDNGKDIDWDVLSGNINAISILEKNQDKINWVMLSSNSSIFELDRKRMNNDISNTL